MADAIDSIKLYNELKEQRWFLHKDKSLLSLMVDSIKILDGINWTSIKVNFNDEPPISLSLPLIENQLAFDHPLFLGFIKKQFPKVTQVKLADFDSSNLIYLLDNDQILKISPTLSSGFRREVEQYSKLKGSNLVPEFIKELTHPIDNKPFGICTQRIHPSFNLWEYLVENPNQIDHLLQECTKHLGGVHKKINQTLSKPILDLKLHDNELSRDQTIKYSPKLPHGDFHLGQVLVNDETLYTIDWEGAPLSNPYFKEADQFLISDLAGLFRSIDYLNQTLNLNLDLNKTWSKLWAIYFNALNALPHSQDRLIMALCLKSRNLYEIDYEKQSRPHFRSIPQQGLENTILFAQRLAIDFSN